MSELDELLDQVRRLGVSGHVHRDGTDAEPCPEDEVCISEEEPFTALVKAPGRTGQVHVDVMTAFGALSNLPDDAGIGPAWAELVSVDRGA